MLVTIYGRTGVKRYLFKHGNPTGMVGGVSMNLNAVKSFSSLGKNGIGDLVLVRFKAVAGPIMLNVSGANGIGDQTIAVEVEAETETGATSNVYAEKSAPQLPSVFDYALFSGTDISK
jgi:hypothetical protein